MNLIHFVVRLGQRAVLFNVAVAMLFCLPLTAQTSTPVILWQPPDPIVFPTPLSSVQLNPVAVKAAPVPVPLSAAYKLTGISTDGRRFTGGGLDGGGRAFSASYINSSIMWRGVSFPLGPVDAPDATYGSTIALPHGQFASLYVLGNLVNNVFPTATLLITYTDGSIDTATQSMSDWTFPMNFPGEFLVKCSATHNNSDGSNYNSPVCLYGYPIPLNPNKVVSSITLPNNPNMVFFSMVLVPPTVSGTFTFNPPAGTVEYPGISVLTTYFMPTDLTAFTSTTASVPLTTIAPAAPVPSTVAWPSPAPIPAQTPLGPTQLDAVASVALNPVAVPFTPYFRDEAFYPDGNPYEIAGFNGDNEGNSYSASQLGSTVYFDGFPFLLGPSATQDAVTGTTLPLPAGTFSTLYLVGASNDDPQPAQPFVITYTDGSTATTLLDISSWRSPQGFADETIVAQTSHANTPAGTQIPGTVSMYGYHIPIDPTRVVQSLTLPNNNQVYLFAASLGFGGTVPVSGTFTYTPPAGTILPVGTHVLATTYHPDYPAFVAPSSGSTTIVVRNTLFVDTNNVARLYGTVNPSLSGTYTGAIPGDQFTLSFATPATILSPAGQYPIVATIAGPNLANYAQAVQNGTLTITPAPVIISVPAANGLTKTQPVSLVVGVQSTTSGTPTGTVTLTENGVAVASAPLVAGNADFPATSVSGPNRITLVYSGDNNFQPSTLVINPGVSVVSLDFVLMPLNGSTFSVTTGQSASFDFNITPVSTVYAAPIGFTLNGSTPPLATSVFSPDQLSVKAGPTNVRLTVNTRLLQGSASRPANPWSAIGPSFAALLLLSCAGGRRTKRLRLFCVPLFMTALLLGAIGCGSGYQNKTYPLTLTATDGTTTHTISITLNVLAPH